MTDATNTADLRAALIEARDWFESQAKAVSKGCGSSYELHDLRVQRDALGAALAAPAQAVPASGPVGFDHKTAANFLNGKTVADEEVRLFVAHSRWAHDDRDWLRNTIADLRREIARRDAEIALLKTSLLDAEALQPAAQAQLEAVGAGGVGPLVGATQRLDRETSQFLSDVMTAAGLVEHGKQCKALAERVANGCRTLRTALAAAAPAPPIMCKPPKSWNKRGQDAYRRGWEAREAALAAAAPAQPVPAPGEPSEAPTQAQVDERSDTVWLLIRLGQKNIRRAITLLEIDSMRAPELAFGPLLLKAIAELRKT